MKNMIWSSSKVDGLCQIIRYRYEDTIAIDNLLNGKVKNEKESIKIQKLIKEIEHRECLRRESEKTVIAQLNRIQIKKVDKFFAHLHKILTRTLPLITFPSLSSKYKKVPMEIHLWDSLNTGYIGKHQEDEINGGWHRNLQLNENTYFAIDFIKNTLQTKESINLYHIMHYIVWESRRHLDQHLIFINSLNEPLPTAMILETLQKNNSAIERSIRKYCRNYESRHENIEEPLLRIVRKLEEEVKGYEDLVINEKYNLSELVNKWSANEVEKEVQGYICILEDEYRDIEGVKHVRRCLYLKSIVAIQRAYKRYCVNKKNKAAAIIQMRLKKWYLNKKRIKSIRQYIALYKIGRWFRLIRKKRILKRNYTKEIEIINKLINTYYNKPETLSKVIKCQSLIRQYLVIHNILPYMKLKDKLKQYKVNKNKYKKVLNLNKELLNIDEDIIQLRLAAQGEIEREENELAQRRYNFELTWKEYEKALEKECIKQTSTHIKNWIVQHNDRGKSYWFNTKTKAQQYNHPGKTYFLNTKNKLYAKEANKFERNIVPILMNIKGYKDRCNELEQSLLNTRIQIITNSILTDT